MSISSSTIAILLMPPAIALAQQANIRVIDLPEPTVRTAERLGAVLGLRQTADGKVLVNDALRRQMLLFDTTLANPMVVMDSVDGRSSSYGPRATALIPFLGDSSLFAEWKSRTVIVLDRHGRVTRTIALPRSQDIIALNAASSGFDAKGRLVFQGGRPSAPQTPTGTPGSGMDVLDSLPILRADLDARRVDTVARIARPVMKVRTQPTSAGTVTTVFALDPLQSVDDWAVLSNGAVAIVRGHDYHVDWIDPDGSTRSTPKLPFEWKRLTDADKHRLGDSLRTAQDSLLVRGYPNAESSVRGPVPCRPPEEGRGGGPPGGGGTRVGRGGGGGDAPPPPPGNGCYERLKSIPAPVGPPMWLLPPAPPVADISRAQPISDYAPPIRMNSAMPDLDGRLWILPRVSTLSRQGELVYDVVGSSGELLERVRVPGGRAIAGFAKGGVVYLTSGDMTNGYYLERTRLPR